jgi:hypothetical protein
METWHKLDGWIFDRGFQDNYEELKHPSRLVVA